MESLREAPSPEEREPQDRPPRSQGNLALALAVIAIALVLVLGLIVLRTARRLESDVARLSEQTEDFRRQVVRAQDESQILAQQAAQAAANAQAAAQQRDVARQDQSNSEAQAELARQQAITEHQKADQATQQAEQYRQQREAELVQLQDALGQIAETHRTAMGLMMTLDNKSIRFDFDKANIRPEDRDVLNRIAGVLMTLKGFSIGVYGYTDDVGSEEYNLQLSQRRAEAVRAFLVQAGIPSTVVTTTKGFGKADARASGDSEQARAANRRVEIGIVDTKLITNVTPVEPK